MGCIAEDRSACPHPRGVSVRLTVCPDPMTAVPRAADEEALRDLNFYLLDADGNVVHGSGSIVSAELDGSSVVVTDSTGATTSVAL